MDKSDLGDPGGMNILHIDTELTWRGGEQQVLWLVEGLLARQSGRQSLAAPPKSVLAERAREKGWEVIEVPMRGGWDFAAARRFADIVRREKINLVHAHTSHAHTLAWLGVARPGLAPVVVTRRVDFPVGGGPFGRLRRAKYLHPRVHLIAISRGVADVLTQGGVPSDRISVVPSGIDAGRLQGPRDRAAIRTLIGATENTAVIGNIAALADHKGQIYLVRAAAILRDRFRRQPAGQTADGFQEFRVAIVGEGEERPRLEAEIQRLGLSGQVRLLGWRSDVANCLAAMDVFCLPSHLEGLGTSMLDALAMGLPVVATRTGGVPDVIIDGENGLLVPPRDPQSLARAVVELLETPELRRRLGEAGRRTVGERFTVDHMVNGTLGVYRTVLGEA